MLSCIQVYFPYTISFPVKWDNQFHTPACFISLIKSWHCQLGLEYLGVKFILLRVYWAGQQLKGGRDQLVERSGISHSDYTKRQRDNLIICDPGVRGKSKETICRICKRPCAKCQTNMCWDEVSCQSEINVSIQTAHTAAEYCSKLTVVPGYESQIIS